MADSMRAALDWRLLSPRSRPRRGNRCRRSKSAPPGVTPPSGRPRDAARAGRPGGGARRSRHRRGSVRVDSHRSARGAPAAAGRDARGRAVRQAGRDRIELRPRSGEPSGRVRARQLPASLGGTYLFDAGHVGVSVTQFYSRYHIPGVEPTQTNTRIDMRQTRIASKGERRPASGATSRCPWER